jgi:hypothetical protein
MADHMASHKVSVNTCFKILHLFLFVFMVDSPQLIDYAKSVQLTDSQTAFILEIPSRWGEMN